MIYNFEYELKLMLSETEYEDLLMLKGCDSFKQTNYYFDTENFDYFNSKTVIRIRVIDETYELTVKTKNPNNGAEGVIVMDENNKAIDKDKARALILGEGDIMEHLPADLLVSKNRLSCVGLITTIRKKTCISEGLPMAELDKSIYADTVDYELEWELSENEYNKAIEGLRLKGILLEDRK
ncbi:MAG: CYTH domain-containing protein, partial [Clostridiales bacterium]|nr:CYTH domain-containing protein [Clostridiales bacterium]